MMIANIGILRNNQMDFGPYYELISKNTWINFVLFCISFYTMDGVLWIGYVEYYAYEVTWLNIHASKWDFICVDSFFLEMRREEKQKVLFCCNDLKSCVLCIVFIYVLYIVCLIVYVWIELYHNASMWVW